MHDPKTPRTPRTMFSHGALIAAVLGLVACGGGGAGGSADGDSAGGVSSAGRLTLAITDGPPVIDADQVLIVFNAISVKPEEGEAIVFDCNDPGFDCEPESDLDNEPDTRTIDLLALNGTTSQILLDEVELAAGFYEWIRLHVDAASPASGSGGKSKVVSDSGAREEDLVIPSGELKFVSGFSVLEGGFSSFTLDLEMRRGLKRTGNGKLILRPAHRLVNNDTDGVLRGEVDPNFEVVGGTPVRDPDVCDAPAVYVYSADGFTTAGQMGSANAPETEANLKLADGGDPSSNFTYVVGFLPEGDYKVAVVCSGEDTGDSADDDVPISAPKDAEIVAGQVEEVNFTP